MRVDPQGGGLGLFSSLLRICGSLGAEDTHGKGRPACPSVPPGERVFWLCLFLFCPVAKGDYPRTPSSPRGRRYGVRAANHGASPREGKREGVWAVRAQLRQGRCPLGPREHRERIQGTGEGKGGRRFGGVSHTFLPGLVRMALLGQCVSSCKIRQRVVVWSGSPLGRWGWRPTRRLFIRAGWWAGATRCDVTDGGGAGWTGGLLEGDL
jgi:hypothetical protein